jgi:hypothetical protein
MVDFFFYNTLTALRPQRSCFAHPNVGGKIFSKGIRCAARLL